MKTEIKNYSILKSPLFLLGLMLLLLNDFFLKSFFGNWWTGKFSDFAGLFIFPLFLTIIFPKRKIECYIVTALLFVFWKMPISNELVLLINDFGIPIGRVVDVTDLIALMILPVSFYYETSEYSFLKINSSILILISCFAFSATSMRKRIYVEKKYELVNQEYTFDYSMKELVQNLNRVTMEIILKKYKKSDITYVAEEDCFYHTYFDFWTTKDTVVVPIAILLDFKKMNNPDTMLYLPIKADVVVSGNDTHSKLKLLNVYRTEEELKRKKDYREKTIKYFERKVIKRLRKLK